MFQACVKVAKGAAQNDLEVAELEMRLTEVRRKGKKKRETKKWCAWTLTACILCFVV